MRSIAVDWLVDVAEEYKIVQEVLFLSVNYLDRYLSRKIITRDELQLLAVTCMFIADKFQGISRYVQVAELYYISDFTCTETMVLS